ARAKGFKDYSRRLSLVGLLQGPRGNNAQPMRVIKFLKLLLLVGMGTLSRTNAYMDVKKIFINIHAGA
ncbi:MAG: hypothetical protein P8M71_05985, partial [Pseudomonadales bacterium]|nr:hypothetical protein [Pseudomonadales bacterium]